MHTPTMDTTTATKWADIPGWAGYYQVSSDGQVRSLDRTVVRRNGSVTKFKSRILRQKNTESGNNSVILAKDGKKVSFSVKTLVKMTFSN